MKAVNGKIIVRADLDQKRAFRLGGIEVMAATMFDTNYRERSPVICQAQHDSAGILAGGILICHHNTFYSPSPYHLFEDYFSIPLKGTIIFCRIDEDGALIPLLDNMMCRRVPKESRFAMPSENTKHYIDRVLVTDPGNSGYQVDELLFTRPYGAYEIVYNWQGELKRVIKCHQSQVVGVYTHNPPTV